MKKQRKHYTPEEKVDLMSYMAKSRTGGDLLHGLTA